MKKKEYINPEITVVALQYQGCLLNISGDGVRNLSIPGDESIVLDPDDFGDDYDDV